MNHGITNTIHENKELDTKDLEKAHEHRRSRGHDNRCSILIPGEYRSNHYSWT